MRACGEAPVGRFVDRHAQSTRFRLRALVISRSVIGGGISWANRLTSAASCGCPSSARILLAANQLASTFPRVTHKVRLHETQATFRFCPIPASHAFGGTPNASRNAVVSVAV